MLATKLRRGKAEESLTKHRAPGLVDDIQTHRAGPNKSRVEDGKGKNQKRDRGGSQFVDVGVEYLIDETDRGGLVRVLVRELNVDLPNTTIERGCKGREGSKVRGNRVKIMGKEKKESHTFFGAKELDVELLHVVIDQGDLVGAHEPNIGKIFAKGQKDRLRKM